MTNKKIEIDYQEFGSVQELEPQDRELCEAAEKALAGSYAPYSNFNVGAAVRLSDGRNAEYSPKLSPKAASWMIPCSFNKR